VTACNPGESAPEIPTKVSPTETLSPTSTITLIPPTPTSSSTPTQTPSLTPTDTTTSTPSPTSTTTQIPTDTPSPSPTAASGYIPENAIVFYLTHLGTGGPIGCGDSLVAIRTGYERTGDIEKDIQLAVDTIFSIGEYSGALFNATYPSNLRVKGLTLSNGGAVVELGGQYVKPKNACDASRYRAQVWSTITQFPEVIRAIPKYQGTLLGDLLAIYSDGGN
jgi:hypothetical protein